MEKVFLRLLKNWKSYKSGDVVSVPPGFLPMRMVENGTAEHYYKEKEEESTDGSGEDLGVKVEEQIRTTEHAG